MKYVYPAIFTKEDGQYLVSVPDLSGCHTFGDTLSEAIEMARDAMSMWLCIAEDNKEEIPKPTIDLKCNDTIVSLIDIDTIAYRRKIDNKAVKKTLSIPSWLNTQAEIAGVNFSGILQEALKNYLNIANK